MNTCHSETSIVSTLRRCVDDTVSTTLWLCATFHKWLWGTLTSHCGKPHTLAHRPTPIISSSTSYPRQNKVVRLCPTRRCGNSDMLLKPHRGSMEHIVTRPNVMSNETKQCFRDCYVALQALVLFMHNRLLKRRIEGAEVLAITSAGSVNSEPMELSESVSYCYELNLWFYHAGLYIRHLKTLRNRVRGVGTPKYYPTSTWRGRMSFRDMFLTMKKVVIGTIRGVEAIKAVYCAYT